jgi:hypothetical protein
VSVDLKDVDFRIVSDVVHLPSGTVGLSDEWPTPERSVERERVRRGIQQGRITAYRVAKSTRHIARGEIYVCRAEAEAWLNTYDPELGGRAGRNGHVPKAVADRSTQSDAVVVPPIVTEDALRRIADALERIAEAAELIATK